jgi:two-component system chemotaxis response regulator CheB
MPMRDIIVIGASAGGRAAIVKLFQALPQDLRAALFVVWHMPPYVEGTLARAIIRESGFPAENARDGLEFRLGRAYVAPPDHHLLIEDSRMRVTQGPKENRFRPAIDPLFRSAAYEYGPRVIGIILSGALSDGTSGLWAVKDRGGIAIVQDPEDALIPGMPRSALDNVQVDYRVPAADLGALLVKLTTDSAEVAKVKPEPGRLAIEVNIAKENRPKESQVHELGVVSELTCPECHGTLWQLREGDILRFRCRTGHAYSAESLLEDLSESVEATLWAGVRVLEESAVLLREIGEHQRMHRDGMAKQHLERAEEAKKRAQLIREALLRFENPGVVGDESE